jgi:pilus assembly protein Flp/PilA
MTLVTRMLAKLFRDERGQDLIEYALLAGFIAVVVGAAFPPLGDMIATVFSRVGSVMAATP